jgi:RNA polymerase sigma factor (sigma-70 family)
MDSRFGEAPVSELDALADEQLLGQYQASLAADIFAEMVRRHQPMVFRTCLRLLGNVHDAEDATQSVFLVLAQRPTVVRRSLAGCLHELARAAVSELCRSQRRRDRREELAVRIHALVSRLRGGVDPMEHQELREELDAALAELPDSLRQAVILRYLEGHSQQEAARQAGCTQTTLGWRAMKGLQRLRSILGRRGVALTPAALLGLLNTEAEATAALKLGSAATAAATATSAQLAATLLRQSATGNLARKVVLLSLLASVSAAVGAGIVYLPRPAIEAASTVPTPPVVASPLGIFERTLDIGGPAHAGGAQLTGTTLTLQGGGTHIYGKADQFRFVYRPWNGDGEILARVTSDPDQDARQVSAGVMFRESLAADSRHVAVLMGALGDCALKFRTVDYPESGCDLSRIEAPGQAWVRLVRRANTFSAFVRSNESEPWKALKELEVPLQRSLYVGLAVTAHDDAQLATTKFDQVSLRGAP